MKIAIIPARGGSKRIPQKNQRPFAGRPVMAYSIAAAVDSKLFDRVVVSTDSENIAALARDLGAETPFVRPADLADDHTPTVPVVRHAIEMLESTGPRTSHVCCIYATAPFLRCEDLLIAYQRLCEGSRDFVFPVTTFAFPIFRALKLSAEEPTDDAALAMIWPEHELTRSQDLPEAVHDAGQFYWGTRSAWMAHDRIYSANTAGICIPRYRVQDLDTPEDWTRAELMYQAMQQSSAD